MWCAARAKSGPDGILSPKFRFRAVGMLQLFALIVVVFLSFGAPPASAAGNLDAAALAAAVEKGRAEQLDVLAPRAFAAAVQASQKATKEAERGSGTERIAARV